MSRQKDHLIYWLLVLVKRPPGSTTNNLRLIRPRSTSYSSIRHLFIGSPALFFNASTLIAFYKNCQYLKSESFNPKIENIWHKVSSLRVNIFWTLPSMLMGETALRLDWCSWTFDKIKFNFLSSCQSAPENIAVWVYNVYCSTFDCKWPSELPIGSD